MRDTVVFQRVQLQKVRYSRRWSSALDGTRFQPPTDVYETEDAVVVTVEVAGLQEGAYEVALSEADQVLTIRGRRQVPMSTSTLIYHQLEIQQGEFVCQVQISQPLAGAESASATYTDGFLVVRLPKAKPKQVPIRTITGP